MMTEPTDGAPTAPLQRYELIDALRGFALAGVLMVNLASLTSYDLLTETARAALPSSGFDAIAAHAMELLVNIKFITLFSLLFGLGFALQLERAQARGRSGLWRYARRLLVLLGIGLVHSYFIWWGDILLTYAVVGLLMLPFARLPDRALLAAGFAIALLPPLLSPWVRTILPAMPTQADVYAVGLEAFASSSWMRTLDANVALANWARVSNWALVCFVLGRFLLGYWAGRRGLLQRPEQHLPLLARIFAWALAIGVAVTALSYLQASLRAAWPLLESDAAKVAIRVLLRIGPLSLGIAYACGFALLFCRPAWRRALRVLAPVGRMALTHYVAQSLVGVMLFYGIGFGIGPRWGMAGLLGAWSLIFAAQVLLSHAWLSRFRYGPLEWLWRWLTYGGRPPQLRRPETERDGSLPTPRASQPSTAG
jgi:uncharacterized protein